MWSVSKHKTQCEWKDAGATDRRDTHTIHNLLKPQIGWCIFCAPIHITDYKQFKSECRRKHDSKLNHHGCKLQQSCSHGAAATQQLGSQAAAAVWQPLSATKLSPQHLTIAAPQVIASKLWLSSWEMVQQWAVSCKSVLAASCCGCTELQEQIV
jgi:hypothetical protein